MNEYYKDLLRKLIVKYKRQIDNCETKDDIENLIKKLKDELSKYEQDVL